MEFLKLIFLIATIMALSVTLTMTNMVNTEEGRSFSITNYAVHGHEEDVPQVVLLPPKRVSRFLKESEERNPRAANHCHKDHEVCYILDRGKNSTCCNNKCVDLKYDRHNCGACKKKCKYTETCCRGECVDVAYDKRHCGKCNNRCKHGEYCIYSMCSYA